MGIMPPTRRAGGAKVEPDQIDLSFLSSDEDIAALRKKAKKTPNDKGKGKAAPVNTQSFYAQGKRSSAASSSTRGQKSTSRKGSARGPAPSSSSSRREAPSRKSARIADDDEEDDEEDSDDDIDIDDIIASMNGGGSRNATSRASQSSKRASQPTSRSNARATATRSRPSAASARSTQRRGPPRQRRPWLANDDSPEGSDADDDDEAASANSHDLQEELDDLNDDSEDDLAPVRRSSRHTQSQADTNRAKASGRAKLSDSRPIRTFVLDDDDDDEEEDDEHYGAKRKSSRSRARPKPTPKAKARAIPENVEDDSEDVWDDDGAEEEEDELVTSDVTDEYDIQPKRKRSTAARSASGSKRRRLSGAASGSGPRSRRSRTTPRRKPSVKRTRVPRVRTPKMRFTLQEDLPQPSLDRPTHEDLAIVEIDDNLTSADRESMPFIEGIDPSPSPSEESSEEEHAEEEAESEEDFKMISNAESGHSSDDVEAYKEPDAAVEKHWPGCKRCTDGPALPVYNKALTTLKRVTKREANKQRNKTPERIDSRGRMRKPLVDDNWGAVTAVQQAEEWIEVLEDRGGWFECKTCSVSWHWGCLPGETQKYILIALNTERNLRHRTVFGESAAAPPPVRWVDLDEMVDTASCPDCTGYASYCTLCKSNVHGERTVGEQLGFTEAMLAQYPDPPAELTASKLFRCKRCSRATHYECLARQSKDSDTTPEKIAEAIQSDGWLCADCHRWPAVEKVIAWRQLDRSLWKDESALQGTYAALSPRENLPREYLVKFKGKSFRETEWVPHDWLRILHQTLLHNFLSKGSRLELEPAELIESTAALASAKKSRASLALGGGRVPPSTPVQTRSVKKTLKVDETGEVDVGPPGPMPDAQRRIPKPWKTPDRVLAVKYYFSLQKDDDDEEIGGDIVDSDSVSLDKLEPSDYLRSWAHVAKLLVKWQDQPYEGSTWEDPPSRRKQADVFYDCQEAYRAFLVAQKVTFPALTSEEIRRKRERRLARSGTSFRALDDQPHCIEGGDLIDFQLEGVNWLRYGWYNQKPGILADEMGLGKTVQIITFLASIWKENKAGPFLVVVPNATLPNWMREFEKWMPQFRVVPYWGEGEARDMISKYEIFHSKKTLMKMDHSIRPIKFHVVVASETSVRIDSLPLRKVDHWDVIIVDEGQNLKSGESVLLKRLNELHAEHRVIMTGTPLNNNVTELFNLLNWLEPGGQWKDVKALESEYSVLKPEVIEELQKRLKPYFLRRLKKDVLDLPPKVELIVPTSLRPIQKRIYRSILESNIEDIQALANSREDRKKRNKKSTIANLNNTLMQLRKCIQHPYLIAPDLETREDEDDYEATWEHQRLIDASAKLSLLQKLLPKLKAQGHRILLFSQFVINLDIVEVFLRGEGYKYLRLDGNVGQKQRQKGIDAFNAPDSPYFIYMISTRAGGVGINLATADTVIIMDPDWNPHVDMQAIARAHRIGQKKKLLVFTLMCKGTAEERIIEGAKRKMMLDHLIVQNLQKEDERPDELESILKFGAQALFAEGGTEETAQDVRYTDEDLDSLLRRREEEASDEEKDQDDEDGNANGTQKGTFAYARVWEADRGADSANGIAPATVVNDDFWADLLEKHREDAAKRAAEAAEKEAQEKRASRRDRIKAILEEDEAVEKAEQPAPVKRGRGRPRKVIKETVDADWTSNAADAPSDSDDDDELVGTVQEEDELLPAVQAMRKRQAKSSDVARLRAIAEDAAQLRAKTEEMLAAGVAAGYDIPGYAAYQKKYGAAAPVVSKTAAPTKSTKAAAAPAKSNKPSHPSLANLQRDLVVEHRLPPPLPLNDIDLSLPPGVVSPGHLAAMRRVLLSLLPDTDFAREVAERSLTGVLPDLAPANQRFQLTRTHINYYMQTFSVPRELFDAAFSIINEDQIPPEILALPHGGAIALDWRKIKELLLRAATYMVLTLRKPKYEQPWKGALNEWETTHAGETTTTVVEVDESSVTNDDAALPDPTPMTAAAAAHVLGDQARIETWVNSINACGDAELTKIAQLIAANPASSTSPSLMQIVQNFVDGKGARPALGPAKLSIRSGLPATVNFVEPEVMGPPATVPASTSIPAAAPSPTPSASTPASTPRPINRVSAALSRLSAFSGGSPMKVELSKKDLSKLNLDVAVNYRKPRVSKPSSRNSIGDLPRSSIAPSPPPLSLAALPPNPTPSPPPLPPSPAQAPTTTKNQPSPHPPNKHASSAAGPSTTSTAVLQCKMLRGLPRDGSNSSTSCEC